MTELVHIEPGQWVLSFHKPYGLHDDITMSRKLETYAFRHWMENWDEEEEFFVMQVDQVKPKTFTVLGSNKYINAGERLPRFNVIRAFRTEAGGMNLRDKLCAIGDGVGDRIHEEMFRRVEKFAQRERAKGLNRVHRCLPEFFGRGK